MTYLNGAAAKNQAHDPSIPYVLAFVGENANGILSWWTSRVMDGLARRGVAHHLIDLCAEDWNSQLIALLTNSRPSFCFSFQGFGMDIRTEAGNLWVQNQIPFVSYLGDNPCHAPSLHAAEGPGIYLLYGCADFLETYQLYMNGRAYAALVRTGYPVNPAAGRIPWAQREHGAVFVKTGINPAALRQAWEPLPAQTRTILAEAAEHLLGGADVTVADSCAAAFQRAHVHWGNQREIFLFACSSVDRYVRAVRAERMVRQLMRHDAFIVGDWPHLDRAGARARFVSPVRASSLDDLYARSRIVVNTLPSIRRGVHERIMAGMLAKAAVISDTTPFLDQALAGCPSFHGLDIDGAGFEDQLDHTLGAALADASMPGKVEQSFQVAERLFSMDAFVEEMFGTIALEHHRRSLGGWVFPPASLAQDTAVQSVN